MPDMKTLTVGDKTYTVHDEAARDFSGSTGILPVAKGGTGANDAAEARVNLGITLENLGAAPAGYGLNNDFTTATTPAQVDEFKSSGWYRYVPSDGTVLIPNTGITYCGIRVDSYSTSGIVVQTCYPTTDYQGCLLRRYYHGDAWGDWEWVNPPMVVGVEYRTTERVNGSAVYTMIVELNAITNGKQTIVPNTITNGLLSISAYANGYPLPFYNSAGELVAAVSGGPATGGFALNTYSNGSGLEGANHKAVVRYTKG